MCTCPHSHKTADKYGLTCQTCGTFSRWDRSSVRQQQHHPRQPTDAPDKSFCYQVPVRIRFDYPDDDEESVIDTILYVPMTDETIRAIQAVDKNRLITHEQALKKHFEKVIRALKRKHDAQRPPVLRVACDITIVITGPITYSDELLS